jgi:hypothetical protein
MRAKLLAAVVGLSTVTNTLRVTPSGENLYTRHNFQAARDYHWSIGNVSENFLGVPANHFTTNNTNVQTYQMRYLLDESHVQANDTYPPILSTVAMRETCGRSKTTRGS